MKIKDITYSSRNDFKAVFMCERCKHEYVAWGYSDGFYYNTVLPNAICPKCGLNSAGENEEQLKTRMGRTFQI